MSEFQKDHTQFDTIETKIHQHLWNIGDELNKLNSFVDRFFAIGVPGSSRRTLQDEIQTVFGAADLSYIICHRGRKCNHEGCQNSREI